MRFRHQSSEGGFLLIVAFRLGCGLMQSHSLDLHHLRLIWRCLGCELMSGLSQFILACLDLNGVWAGCSLLVITVPPRPVPPHWAGCSLTLLIVYLCPAPVHLLVVIHPPCSINDINRSLTLGCHFQDEFRSWKNIKCQQAGRRDREVNDIIHCHTSTL